MMDGKNASQSQSQATFLQEKVFIVMKMEKIWVSKIEQKYKVK